MPRLSVMQSPMQMILRSQGLGAGAMALIPITTVLISQILVISSLTGERLRSSRLLKRKITVMCTILVRLLSR